MRRRIALGILPICIGLAALSSLAEAQPPAPAGANVTTSQHVRVNEFTFSAQAEAALAVDQAGNIAVAWSSRRQQDGRSGVYMKQYASSGAVRIRETAVNLFTQSHATAPAIACGLGGDIWIAWKSHGQDGDAGAIIARRFTIRDNKVVGSDEILVNQHTEGDQDNPIVSISRDGKIAIAWITFDKTLAPTARVRLFDPAAVPVTDEITIPVIAAAGARSCAIAWGAGDTLAVVTAVIDELSMPAGLQFHSFDGCGQLIDSRANFGGACDGAAADRTRIEPVLAHRPGSPDGLVAAWLELAAAGGYRVIAQQFDLAGHPICEPMDLTVERDGSPSAPAIAVGPGDEIAVAWNQSAGASDSPPHICVRQLSPHSTTRFLNSAGAKQAMRPATATTRLAMTPDGNLLCAWSGDADLGDESGVHLTIATLDDSGGDPSSFATAARIETDSMNESAADQFELSDTIAAPHEPPIFDPVRGADAEREIREGTNEFGFTAVTSTGWTPPDPHMGVGLDHIVVMTNGAIAFFSKAGQLQFQASINGAGGFWGPAGAVANLVFDPEVFYDELSGRFFAIAGEGNAPGGRSYALLAISDDSNPNGTWHKYRFETTPWAGAVFDSINLGVDASVVYISGDAAGSAVVHPVLTFEKAPLLAGVVPAMRVTLMPTSIESAGLPPVSFDNPPAKYFIEHTEFTVNTTVRLYALTNPLGTPSFVSTNLMVPAYGPPELVPQAGTTVKFQTFDARFWSVAYRNGSLWATHHINSDRCLARWYQIAMNGWPSSGQQPSLVQWGNIDPGPGIRTFFSAITVDDAGNASMVFARSSPTEFASMATAHRAAGDPPGTFQPSEIRKTSSGPWTANDRWGDYGAIAIDPVDGFTVWAHHEYAQSNSWLTWVQRFTPLPPGPANDLCADATLIGAGAHAFTTVGAATDGPNEPGSCLFNGSSNLNHDVWFKYLAMCTGTATVQLCGADFNSKVAVYGSACPAGQGEVIVCNDDFCEDDAQVTFATTANTLYRIRIGSPVAASGSGVLNISCTPGPTPCPADISPPSGDGVVNVNDLLAVINAWGACPAPCPADIAPAGGDGVVNVADMLTVINAWGACP